VLNRNISDLVEVYKEASIDCKDEDYQSLQWDKYYKKNIKFLDIENIINFRKHQVLSKGMDDAMNLVNKLNLIEALDNFGSTFLRRTLPEKNIGNSNYSENFIGYSFDYGIIHHLKWFEIIEKYLDSKMNILEIGGGFGSLARIIIKNTNAKYFLIDLPEANLLSNYYLQSHFPEKRVFNYKNFKETGIKNQIDKFDIFILPPNILDKIEVPINFVINTRSFMEMDLSVIKKYFDHIQKYTAKDGFFLNINRYVETNDDGQLIKNKFAKGERRYFYEYPYDEFWKVQISEKSFLQPQIHFLLTKRTSQKGDISDEINKIKNNKKLYSSYSYLRIKFALIYFKLKRILWLSIKKTLIFIMGKNKIKKIAKILYSISVYKD
jgi:putative sugar O-methyltransferase